jgi:hypothetical protein
MTLPRLALAVRQPWTWAIIHAGKDLENRDWRRWIKDWWFRGRVAILASKGMTQDEYAMAQDAGRPQMITMRGRRAIRMAQIRAGHGHGVRPLEAPGKMLS